MALRVVEIVPPLELEDRSDDYLPVLLRFGPERLGFYCYFEQREGGPNEGYIELKVAEETGELIGATTLTMPKPASEFPADVPIVEGSVRLDLTRWAELGDDPRVNFVRETAPLTVAKKDNATYYSLSEATPVKFIVSGQAGFGVGPDDELTGVLTRPT